MDQNKFFHGLKSIGYRRAGSDGMAKLFNARTGHTKHVIARHGKVFVILKDNVHRVVDRTEFDSVDHAVKSMFPNG